MKAKDKAIELVDKFTPKVYCYLGSGMLTNDYNGEVAKENAKQCALICVEEQIELLTKIDPPRDFRNSSFSMELMKLKQLKQEIEKL